MKRFKTFFCAALCALLLCGCAQPAENVVPTAAPTLAPTPAPTPEPTPEPLLPVVEYNLCDGDRIEADFDGDGVSDSITFSGEMEVTFTVKAAGCEEFTCTMPCAFGRGSVLGLDFGDGAYTWIFSSNMGFNGGAGAIYTTVYRLQNGKYELFLESLPMQQFTGSIGADGASVSIERV